MVDSESVKFWGILATVCKGKRDAQVIALVQLFSTVVYGILYFCQDFGGSECVGKRVGVVIDPVRTRAIADSRRCS